MHLSPWARRYAPRVRAGGAALTAALQVAISTFYAQFGTDGTQLPLKAAYVNATSAPGGGAQLLQPRTSGRSCSRVHVPAPLTPPPIAGRRHWLPRHGQAVPGQHLYRASGGVQLPVGPRRVRPRRWRFLAAGSGPHPSLPHRSNAVVWATMVIDKSVTKQVCGRPSATDLTLHFLWHKFCAAAKRTCASPPLSGAGSGCTAMLGPCWRPPASGRRELMRVSPHCAVPVQRGGKRLPWERSRALAMW